MQVASILKSKGASVVTLPPTATILEVIHKLTGEGIGSVVLSGNGTKIEGINSERDIVQGFAEHGPDIWGVRSKRADDLERRDLFAGHEPARGHGNNDETSFPAPPRVRGGCLVRHHQHW